MAQLIINEHRQNLGMPKLARYPGMDSFAQEWAEEMARTGVLKHSGLGPYKGEVIASGAYTAEAVVNLWMNSPAHKEIILRSSFTMAGIGYSRGYWVMVFS
jgi:uncharacterized protein YkwD